MDMSDSMRERMSVGIRMDEVDRLLAVDQEGGSSDENRHVIIYSRRGHITMDLGGE